MKETPSEPEETATAPAKKASRKPVAQADTSQTSPLARRLLRSIGMAMPSNRFRVFLGRGAIPPVSEKKHFVAKLRKLDRLEVIVLEGDDELANNNDFVGEVGMTNIKLRADGRAEIEIDFSLSDNGILSIMLNDRIARTECICRFLLPQFRGELHGSADLSVLPVEELSQKIDLLEQQMQLLQGELTVRGEGE